MQLQLWQIRPMRLTVGSPMANIHIGYKNRNMIDLPVIIHSINVSNILLASQQIQLVGVNFLKILL